MGNLFLFHVLLYDVKPGRRYLTWCWVFKEILEAHCAEIRSTWLQISNPTIKITINVELKQ